MKTSIIFTCYLKSKLITKLSLAALCNIRKYTDPDEYELIVIDDVPGYELENDGYFRDLDFSTIKHVVNDKNFGYCANMNQGAKLATGTYLCFIENDIFVPDNWLPELRYYLENDLTDIICPQQFPKTYAQMQMFKKLPYDDPQIMYRGWDEQGVMMMKKEFFEKTGGWDERFKKIFGWKWYLQKVLHPMGARIHNTAKVQITHVTGSSYFDALEHDNAAFREQESIEAQVIHDELEKK